MSFAEFFWGSEKGGFVFGEFSRSAESIASIIGPLPAKQQVLELRSAIHIEAHDFAVEHEEKRQRVRQEARFRAGHDLNTGYSLRYFDD